MTKMAKTKFARKNEYMRLSETKDWKTGQDFAGRPKRKLLTLKCKTIYIKSIFCSSFNFINPCSIHCF